MWGENLPSGRERAIETLIDMEPRGAFYRASRVLEESVPHALSHRPNLVTKSALVEQAYALAKYEIDQLSKYDAVFGERQNASFSDRLVSPEASQKDRILRHHAKILAAKRGTARSSLAPSPQLVAALRRVYGESESLELRSLLQSVMDHSAFSQEEDGYTSSEDGASPGAYHLEALVADICRNETDHTQLHGLLISILSVVTGYEVQGNIKSESKEELDPTSPPPLQVGAVLSVVRPEEDDKNAWSLDGDLLSYLGQASATYEERIEIQKARLLAKLEEPKEQLGAQIKFQTLKAPVAEPAGSGSSSDADIPSTPMTPQPAATPPREGAVDAVVIPEDSDAQNGIEAAAAALSAAVFEQIISAATGEESSEDNDSSDSDHDSDYQNSGRHGLEGESSSSSSSSNSEVELGEDGNQAGPHGESEGDEDNGDDDEGVDADDDMILRQALALSLADQSQLLHVDTGETVDDSSEVPMGAFTPGPITPGSETPVSLKEPMSIPEPEESPLPAFPVAPKTYPYAHLLDANIDSDKIETESPYLDPSSLNRFGAIPAPHVLVHLLRFTLETIERRKFQGREETLTTSRQLASESTIPGGIGCYLFPPNRPFLKPERLSRDAGSEISVSLQMLGSLFLLVNDRRNDAIEKLKHAAALENRTVEVEGDNMGQGNDESGTPTSEEGDDPAIALALHYLDGDAGESTESLEAKGMRRKAAAAAHDAAALLTSLRRRTEAWKHQVKLFSHCAILSMKCLRSFLQYVARLWLQERQGISAVGCSELLPRSMSNKLSAALASLTSTTFQNSNLGLVLGAENEVEEIFMSLRLYQDSLLLWGEAVPIIYPSVAMQTDLLRSLLSECSNLKIDYTPRSLEKMTSWPSSDLEYAHHQLQMLCRRLRVSDLLDKFVSSPACYLPQMEESSETHGTLNHEEVPQRVSSVIALIGSQSALLGGITGELQNFYLALCHRCHAHVLLWDGLFACTDTESDDVAMSLVPSPGDMMQVSVSTSSSLAFDTTKCSDSMAILPNQGEGPSSTSGSATVHQRASKVWGTVLSSNCFMPKTGVHRWAVRLDKCERGHVFIGVATTQASMRTYVGGDKYGWGMIGTQALWHDRRKIRGDYGATFRTGSTIVVTLDTDAGTLSFCSWKDNTASTTFSLDPMVQNVDSPRRHRHVGGSVEDWGVAFEGLPLDSKLYPAVGLYQRDDRVTLLSVESGGHPSHRENALDLSGGLCYFPRFTEPVATVPVVNQLNKIRKFNDVLSWDGIEYTLAAMERVVDCIETGADEFLSQMLLPSLAAALCLLPPTIPMLSQRSAMILLPKLAKWILKLGKLRSDRVMAHRLFQNGLHEGKWVIRATGLSGSSTDSEEYVVDFRPTTNENGSMIGFEGTGVGTTGKSKNGLVAIFGTVKGSAIHFVEEWTDGNDEGFGAISNDDAASTCVATARLSLDGKKFEGTYRNVQFGTTGQIAGLLASDERKVSSFRRKDAPPYTKQSAAVADALVVGETLLCLAQSHLATILGEDAASDFSFPLPKPHQETMGQLDWKSRYENLKACLALPILSSSSSRSSEHAVLDQIEGMRTFYAPPVKSISDSDDYLSLLSQQSLKTAILPRTQPGEYVSFDVTIENMVGSADNRLSSASGGKGSLVGLARKEYQDARLKLICAFIHHGGLNVDLTNAQLEGSPMSLRSAWSAALRIMEDGVRSAVAKKSSYISAKDQAKELCLFYCKVAEFLVSLERHQNDMQSIDSAAADVKEMMKVITGVNDVDTLQQEMLRSTQRCLLRLISVHEMDSLLIAISENNKPLEVEALLTGVPRLLGRGMSHERQADILQRDDLGGHYLTNLPGALGAFRCALEVNTHTLWATLCKIAQRAVLRRRQCNLPEALSIDSMTLALAASFTTAMHCEDIEYLVLRSDYLPMVASILDVHRDLSANDVRLSEEEDTKVPIVKELSKLGDREVSRSVIRASVAMCHVVVYQALQVWDTVGKDSDGLSMCLAPVLSEIEKTVNLVDSALQNASRTFHKTLGKGQWEEWLEQATKTDSTKIPLVKSNAKRGRLQVGRSGINYLLDHGVSQITAVQSSSQKPPVKARTGQNPSSKMPESAVKIQDSFCHLLLTQWLHILVAASRSQSGRKVIANDKDWIAKLFGMVGLTGDLEGAELMETVSVPGRYRSRILRIICPFLELLDATPVIAKSLFALAGRSNLLLSKNFVEDESPVSHEAISLLRRLHSPRLQQWRSVINGIFAALLEASTSPNTSLASKLGVVLFFNGGVEGVSRGTFVLLKPAAAVPLSAEQQAMPSSKSSSSGGHSSTGTSTPHHIVGNGTEGVVAGLCREDASAGIVSSIDSRNGMCEIVLLNRDSIDADDNSQVVISSFHKKSSLSPSRSGASPRHTLTVRALRSPLSDIVHAQEVSLYLDEDMGVSKVLLRVLKEALEITAKHRFEDEAVVGGDLKASLSEDGCPSWRSCVDRIRSDIIEVTYAAMVVKSSISALADDRVLESFLREDGAKEVLSKMLRVAYCEELPPPSKIDFLKGTHCKSLSSLPRHEARSAHALNMLRGVETRLTALRGTSECGWEDRISEYSTLMDDLVTPVALPQLGPSDGYSTPPIEPGIGLDTPSAIDGENARTNNEDNATSRQTEASSRAISQSTVGSENSDDEEDEAGATAAAHLMEAAIAQMAELGLPRSWSELALRRTGGTNIEAAVHFCLERGGEMERLLAEDRERERTMQRPSSGSSRRRGNRDDIGASHLLRQLMEMGFPSRWCAEALAATGNNVDEALTWILTNGERLSAEDEGMEDGEDDEDIDDEDDEDSRDDDESDVVIAATAAKEGGQEDIVLSGQIVADGDGEENPECIEGWRGSIIPVRFISGRSIINSRTLAISGLPTGGFSSVGTKGILLTAGKWYYEAILETAGCLQIGWADGSFAGHCHADRGDGCGDGPSSWAFDGWRRYRWHATATEWGCRWNEGDVIGCMVDMDDHIVSFTLNGRAEEIGMGVAFSGHGFRPCSGVYPCVSFNRKEKLRLILGGRTSEAFRHAPPLGYSGVGEAILNAVEEREFLVGNEKMLDKSLGEASETEASEQENKRFLCDFSDGEHGHELMAWAHRYYGSDASVHLGSGRVKASGTPKSTSPSSAASDTSVAQSLNRQITSEWSKSSMSPSRESTVVTRDAISCHMENGYIKVAGIIRQQALGESFTLSSLFARKLLLHILITMGDRFDPELYLSSDSTKHKSALRFWKMIEECASLRSAGWVGEAGAMAIAAEALGLGISSNDHVGSRHSTTERVGHASLVELGDGMSVPSAGIVQVLSTVLKGGIIDSATATSCSLAASSEAAIGSDGGGVFIFLQKGLEAAIGGSPELRQVVVASVRRYVRLLAVVEYDNEETAPSETPEEDESDSASRKMSVTKEGEKGECEALGLPDARLVSYITGLLLSPAMESSVENHDKEIKSQLFEAWSVGMLSASLPWRMVCAFTSSGILNSYPPALANVVDKYPTLRRFYGRLFSTVARRAWAERAAMPICSRYTQAIVELLASVKRSVVCIPRTNEFFRYWDHTSVDAATPLPVPRAIDLPESLLVRSWEAEGGWVSSDCGWEIWTGSVHIMALDWKTPSRSAVRTLMDGGDGPPMLREGCTVMRGLDWTEGPKGGQEDGKELYEAEKAKRDAEKRAASDSEPTSPQLESNQEIPEGNGGDVDDSQVENPFVGTPESKETLPVTDGKCDNIKKKKTPSPKLPLGSVLAIEPWEGNPAMARRVRWHLTGEEGIYRYGGDGGRYDISHVEVNEKATRVRKRHPLPESAEQCAARHGFGAGKRYSVLLRLRRSVRQATPSGAEPTHQGIMEWPDLGAAIVVDCTIKQNGDVLICEKEVLYGSKDSGWEARFGQPSFVPGTVVVLHAAEPIDRNSQAEIDAKSPYSSLYEELAGTTTYAVANLRSREDASKLRLTSELRLTRSRKCEGNEGSVGFPILSSPLPAPIHFDRDYHAPSLALSKDGRTVSCVSSDGRGTAFSSMGFTKGVHYWEVKLEQADIGSVFIGVAEKPTGNGSGSSYGYDTPPKLNRWHGWGFVNFRATYTAGAERIYGAHCHAGDTVGVLLDCDAGRISFFFDGLKYGEHILNDLGCAFENVSPFGFNVDGCGSGGAGQGAPSGVDGGRSGRYPAQGAVRPRALWPVVGLRNPGDRVTLSPKWSSSFGIDGISTVENILACDEILHSYESVDSRADLTRKHELPDWFVAEAFSEYRRWKSGTFFRSVTRGSGPYRLSTFGLDFDLDSSVLACASASALLGLNHALLAGDRVRLKRSAGRLLELAEEAVVLGAYQGRLYYRIVSQKSEGGSLTEGGGRAWCWDESEVVDGISFIGEPRAFNIALPLMDRFRCTSSGGLKIEYEGGAVVRSDLEIFDGSANLGSIPVNTVIPKTDVLERRVNSCGVVRYRVKFETLEGWISSRIRGGKEEAIVAPVHETTHDEDAFFFPTPMDCALEWLHTYEDEKGSRASLGDEANAPHYRTEKDDMGTFKTLLQEGICVNLSAAESDSLIARAVGAISDLCDGGNPLEVPFNQLATALSFAFASKSGTTLEEASGSAVVNQVAAAAFGSMDSTLPSTDAVLARVALLRALNRRAKIALPWLSLRPSQEGSALFGGIYGHGASIERAGRSCCKSSTSQWIQVPSIASKLRAMRGLIFSCVKRNLLQGITEATTTPTPLSHDEYELPREIRTVRLNRLKARRVMEGGEMGAKRKHSVFAQLQNETKSWGGAALRRGFVAKGHGGQKRAFKVKLIGEGVNDYSGPYREAFTDALTEVLKTENNGIGSLGVLDRTPNSASQIGDNRDLFMFSVNGRNIAEMCTSKRHLSDEERRIRESFSTLLISRDEASREVEDALVFLGRITGTAYRHGILLDLPLPLESAWKAIAEEPSDKSERLQELDALSSQQRNDDDFSNALILWQQKMLNSFVEGLSNVLPVEVLSLLSGEELREMICGNPDVDVDLLRRVVEYEGYEESDAVIQFFWDTLSEFSNEERKTFLQFVWARNRLPMREIDFDAPFKIQKDTSKSNGEQALPSASTCFFSLTLPEYGSKELLKAKLLFAINNVTTMETDFQTNSAEIAEGYRAF